MKLAYQILIAISVLGLCVHASRQANQHAQRLELGHAIVREMTGGEVHIYQIRLTAGQYLRVVVEQRGIDVVVALRGPDHQKLLEVNSPVDAQRPVILGTPTNDDYPYLEVDYPEGARGQEQISLVTATTGSYWLEIRARQSAASAGHYEVRIEDLRVATKLDKSRVAAQQAAAEGKQLRAAKTVAALRKAVEKFVDALKHWRAARDWRAEAETLNHLALVYLDLGEQQKAIAQQLQALRLWQALGERRGEAYLLHCIGVVYDSWSRKQQALDYYSQSLRLWRAIGDRRGEAYTLSCIGGVYDALGEEQKALDYYHQAIPLLRSVGSFGGEAAIRFHLGWLYLAINKKPEAVEHVQQSLQLWRAASDHDGEIHTLNQLGLIYDKLEEKQQALDCYEQALRLSQAVGNIRGEARTLRSFGLSYHSLGEKQRAIDYYNRALQLMRQVDDFYGEVLTLIYLGDVYWQQSEYQKALGYYTQGLPISRAVGANFREAFVLFRLGQVYESLGEKQRALDSYGQALPLWRAVGDRDGEAYTLNHIGTIYESLGKKQDALDQMERALQLMRAVGDRYGEALTFDHLGVVYSSLGEKQKALDYFEQALPLWRPLDRRGEARTLNHLGSTYESLGEQQKALEHFNQALRLSQTESDYNGEAETRYYLARAERGRGQDSAARAHIETALQLIESLRVKFVSPELRAAYFASAQKYYEFYIDLLMSLHWQDSTGGFAAAALQANERARARSLLELLVEARANLREGVDLQLLERERSLQKQINQRAQALSHSQTKEEADVIAKEILLLTAQYQEVEAQIRTTNPRYAALTRPAPLNLAEIQQQILDSKTLLLEYALGEERSYLWLVTPDEIKCHILPKRAEIEAAAKHVYDLLTGSPAGLYQTPARAAEAEARYWQAASELSQTLLGPVGSQLKNKRLLIVSEGALQYLPFAALPAPKDESGRMKDEKSKTYPSSLIPHPLIVDHEIINLPSASALAVLRRETAPRPLAPKAVAVLADPVFDREDERLRRSLGGLRAITKTVSVTDDLARAFKEVRGGTESRIPRLPFTRREAEAILVNTTTQDGLKALDFKASRTTVTGAELGQYRIVHFATHGLLNLRHPELSGIVLSLVDERGQPQDGFLRLNEIYNLKLPAELIVLSACQTGLGKEVRGEGLVGLTRGFMYAGAKRVVASLWKVDDVATAELMKRFYAEILGERRLAPAAALREAQIAVWKQRRWQAPYYWAAFVLQGEFK